MQSLPVVDLFECGVLVKHLFLLMLFLLFQLPSPPCPPPAYHLTKQKLYCLHKVANALTSFIASFEAPCSPLEELVALNYVGFRLPHLLLHKVSNQAFIPLYLIHDVFQWRREG